MTKATAEHAGWGRWFPGSPDVPGHLRWAGGCKVWVSPSESRLGQLQSQEGPLRSHGDTRKGVFLMGFQGVALPGPWPWGWEGRSPSS